jgi:cellulose synthase operon protein C
MTQPCSDLVPFVDGELAPEHADAFRTHLPTCAACRAGVLEATQLSMRLEALSPAPPHVQLVPAVAGPTEPRVEPSIEPPDEPPDETPDETPEAPEAPAARLGVPAVRVEAAAARTEAPALQTGSRAPWWRRHRVSAAAAALVPAAAAVALVLWPRDVEPVNAFAALTTRPYEVRFAYADATGYRPMPDVQRGGSGGHGDSVPYEALAAYQRTDQHALAIARVWNRESLAKVAEQLRALPETPAIRSDRAAVAILFTTDENAEPLLAELDKLAKLGAGSDPAARAARWNYALLLARLELSRSAAQAFRAIANEREAGWAEEAAHRADVQDQRAHEMRERWDRADAAGKALLADGTSVPPDVMRVCPGLIRAYFYDAVRTAPTRDRVLALAPLAAELDRFSDPPVLADYVQRVATANFARRAPLASAYAQVLLRVPLAPAARAELTSDAAPPDVADIVMSAMIELNAVADHAAALRRLAEATRDPWSELELAEAEARAAVARGEWLSAEARLLEAQKRCTGTGTGSLSYRCLAVARQLGTLYHTLHRVPEALAVVRSALDTARSTGTWGRYFELMYLRADIERYNSSIASARAYVNELLLMAPEGCLMTSAMQRILAAVAVRDLDGRAARRALDLVLRCEEPGLEAANFLADIGRLDARPDDMTRLQGWLRTLRASGKLTAVELVTADEIEGRLLVERDRAAGIALLERAITAIGALGDHVGAAKVRTGAYSVLVFDAARQGDHARVLRLIAQELGLSLPPACAVGMVAEDERAAIVVRGADGEDRATYVAARRPDATPLAVPAELARNLESCGRVQVMAQASLQGQPRVLPPTLAWSYITGDHSEVPPRGRAPTPHSLIVSNVTPPAFLQLPVLAARPLDPPSDHAPSIESLSGRDATPARVLAAMRDATEIQFHSHALVDGAVSSASHLVLSPGDGVYALTAEAIRGIELRGRPIIVLAACRSAQGARYQYAPWSLPHAFLAGGARAVVAAGTDIPDTDAGPFFSRVLARVRTGADPAVALRDERMAILTSTPNSWVADVMVFE